MRPCLLDSGRRSRAARHQRRHDCHPRHALRRPRPCRDRRAVTWRHPECRLRGAALHADQGRHQLRGGLGGRPLRQRQPDQSGALHTRVALSGGDAVALRRGRSLLSAVAQPRELRSVPGRRRQGDVPRLHPAAWREWPQDFRIPGAVAVPGGGLSHAPGPRPSAMIFSSTPSEVDARALHAFLHQPGWRLAPSTVTVARAGLWALLAAHLVALWGLSWDIRWHLLIGRDSFWIAPHLMTYSGATLIVLVSFGVLEWTISQALRGVATPGMFRQLRITGTRGYHLAAYSLTLTV